MPSALISQLDGSAGSGSATVGVGVGLGVGLGDGVGVGTGVSLAVGRGVGSGPLAQPASSSAPIAAIAPAILARPPALVPVIVSPKAFSCSGRLSVSARCGPPGGAEISLR